MMKIAIVATFLTAAGLAAPCMAEAATITYGSVDIPAGSDIEARYHAARDYCEVEAQTPPRGTARIGDFYYHTALNACLYRQGFSENGEYAYPVPLFGSPSRHNGYKY